MARVVSLLLGMAVMLVSSIFPFVLAKHATGLNQSIFLMVMIGMTGAFIHGTGFQPRLRIWRWLASPIFAWPLMIFGFGAMAALK